MEHTYVLQVYSQKKGEALQSGKQSKCQWTSRQVNVKTPLSFIIHINNYFCSKKKITYNQQAKSSAFYSSKIETEAPSIPDQKKKTQKLTL